MPYTEASLREVLRLDNGVPSGVPHEALRATTVSGYDLPKGGFVVTGLQSANLDKNKFSDAFIYRPERFLDRNGHLALKEDVSLPFGAGIIDFE